MRLLISVLLLAALAAPASALSTAQRNADGGVTIRSNVSNGAILDPGDDVAFQYQTARDAAVIIFDIDTQGNVTLLTDNPVEADAREQHRLQGEFTAEGEPGVEFVFALAVPDRGAIDEDAFASMRDENRRITGDPFIAANMIAGELVRDISQKSVFIGYTYFYVSERADYPCYLCGTCDGGGGSGDCEGYRIVQNFDRNVALSYPLARGYEMVETASNQTETVTDSAEDNVAIPDEPTEVNFYPYGSEVHYADPVAVNLWYTWGWYDPFFWYYPYSYPYYSPWQVSIGFGWGWGWGGYYCSGWYDPWYGYGYYPGYPYYPYYPYYPDSRPVTKYKSQYKGASSNTLTANRQYATKSDPDLRVASKGVKSGSTRTAWNTTRSGRTSVSKDPFTGSSHRVKTSVNGGRSVTREAWAKGRSGSQRNVPVYRGQRSQKSQVFQPKSSAGKSVRDRSGTTRVKSGSYAPSRSKGSWNAPTQRSAPRPSSHGRSAPRMGAYKGSTSAPSFRGGGGWGGSRGGTGGMGGGMRGGAVKGGRGR